MGQTESWAGPPNARLDLKATATLLQRGGSVGRFTVQNLSAGGALLTGNHDVRPSAPLRVLLELPSGDSVTVGAHVRRRAISGEFVALAVAFRHLNSASEDRIQDAILELLDQTHRADHPAVLVVDQSAAVRADLVERVAGLGRRALSAEAPLTALRVLDDPLEHIDTVIVREAPGAGPGVELLEFVAEHYRGVRPILLVEDPHSDPIVKHRQVQRCRPEDLHDVLA